MSGRKAGAHERRWNAGRGPKLRSETEGEQDMKTNRGGVENKGSFLAIPRDAFP